jgi:hypothetical protein
MRHFLALTALTATAMLAIAASASANPHASPPVLQPAFWVDQHPHKVTPVIEAGLLPEEISGQALGVKAEGDGGNISQSKLARHIGEDCHATGKNCGQVAKGWLIEGSGRIAPVVLT